MYYKFLLLVVLCTTFFCPFLSGQELMTSSNFVYKLNEDVTLTSLIRTRTNIGDNYPIKKTDNELRIGEIVNYSPIEKEIDFSFGHYINKIDRNIYSQRTLASITMYPIKLDKLSSIYRIQYDYNHSYSNNKKPNDRFRFLFGWMVEFDEKNKLTTSYEYLTTTESRYVLNFCKKISDKTALFSSLEVRKYPGFNGNPIIIIGFKHKLN